MTQSHQQVTKQKIIIQIMKMNQIAQKIINYLKIILLINLLKN